MSHNSNHKSAKSNQSFRFLHYPFSIVKQLILLPKIVHQQKVSTNKIHQDIIDTSNKIIDLINIQSKRIDDTNTHINSMSSRLNNIQHLNTTSLNISNPAPNIQTSVMDDHSLDWFYKLFEDKFRGSEDSIRERVSEYKKYFESLSSDLKKLPIIDIGCGRGEFLGFAKDLGFKAIGVDLNFEMIEHSKNLGYKVFQEDAVKYLSTIDDNSISVITGFHIVEHIPLNSLIKLFEECYRSIKKNGFVLFETPNPRNINVGSNTFYIDPSHMKPIPQEFLTFALESVGFKTEVIESHPIKTTIEHTDDNVRAIMYSLYGPQDYAVIARK